MKISLVDSVTQHFIQELEVEVLPRIGEALLVQESAGPGLDCYLVKGVAHIPVKGMILVYGQAIRRDAYPLQGP